VQLAELLAGDPELDKLADDVICPVCLDLLHEPFQVLIVSRISVYWCCTTTGTWALVGGGLVPVLNVDEKRKISSFANPRLFLAYFALTSQSGPNHAAHVAKLYFYSIVQCIK
jgi:hypothetical protein